jgi:hypothetical protein
MIDLDGDGTRIPDDERAQARGRADLAVMTDGATIRGEVVRVVSDNRERWGDRANADRGMLVFRTQNGYDRRIPMRDLRRIYFGNAGGEYGRGDGSRSSDPNWRRPSDYPNSGGQRDYPNSTGQRGQTTGPTRDAREVTVRVPANQQWVDSGLTVQDGQPLTITATGSVVLSADQNDKAGPNGAASGRKAAKAPLPQTPAGALIGRIGNGKPFGIGAGPANINAPGAGRLYFGVNDDWMDDNVGEYQVRVSGAEAGRQYSDRSSEDNGSSPRRRP